MKKIALAFMALLTLSQAVVAKNVTVQTKGMSLVIDVENGKHPTFVYFGHKISDADISNLTTPGNYSHQEIYLPYGPAPQAEPAFAARHYDGNMSTELNAVGYDQWQDGTSTVTTIHLKDPQYGLTVDVNYRAYKDVDMIETWTDIKNGEGYGDTHRLLFRLSSYTSRKRMAQLSLRLMGQRGTCRRGASHRRRQGDTQQRRHKKLTHLTRRGDVLPGWQG